MAIWRITCRLEWAGGGSPGVNVFHARRDTTGPSGDSFIEDLETFYTAVQSYLANDVVVTIGDSITDVETQEFVEGTPRVVNGTGSGGDAPDLLQVCVPWRTSVRARRGMGRTFLGPLSAGLITSTGTPGAGGIAAIQAAADALVAESTGTALGAFGVWGYAEPKPRNQPRPDNDPKVLRDWVQAGRISPDNFSYLSSRRD